jgi:uncharacterized protein YqeY
MTLSERIMGDYKEAMKAKDQNASSVLSFLRAQMSYAALDKKKDTLDDPEVVAVIKKLVKQHQDSIEQFTAGGRKDLAEKEEKELVVLKRYLPEEMDPAALAKLIDDTVKETGAAGIKDMGRVMKEVMARAAGRADSKTVSDKVRERLLKGA